MPQELQQVFLNLVMNASQAIGKGGNIWIASRAEGDGVVVDVEDDGGGIAPEILEKIFDPFFTTKPVGEGTGLGLSLAFGIVRKHGGEITRRIRAGEPHALLRAPSRRRGYNRPASTDPRPPMKLYDSTLAPNPRRVRVFLAEKGIQVPTVQVDIGKAENREAAVSREEPARRRSGARARRRHRDRGVGRDLPLLRGDRSRTRR